VRVITVLVTLLSAFESSAVPKYLPDMKMKKSSINDHAQLPFCLELRIEERKYHTRCEEQFENQRGFHRG